MARRDRRTSRCQMRRKVLRSSDPVSTSAKAQTGSNSAWRSIEQDPRLHFQRLRELFHDGDSRVAGAALEVADVGAVDLRLEGERLLRPVILQAEATQVLGEALSDVHAGMTTCPSTIDLQTISDICLDCRATWSDLRRILSSTEGPCMPRAAPFRWPRQPHVGIDGLTSEAQTRLSLNERRELLRDHGISFTRFLGQVSCQAAAGGIGPSRISRDWRLAALALAAGMLFAQPAAAADNFIQLYIAAQGGCGQAMASPLTFVLSGQDARAPFGKAAEDWSDDDLASLKTVLAACQIATVRRGNEFNIAEIKRDADELLAKIPVLVAQARDQVQARNQQIEARRQLAVARIDKAVLARQQAKASAETEAARLEGEAAAAEAEAREAQRRADARIERATRARDEAKATAAAVASLERSAQQRAAVAPVARRAAPGELSELEDEPAGQNSAPAGPVIATTVVEAQACKTIDAVAASNQQGMPQHKSNAAPAASGACLTVAKGSRATVQAADATPSLKALCVALEGQPGCLWMAKAAFGALDQP